jgi:hypothetical protein
MLAFPNVVICISLIMSSYPHLGFVYYFVPSCVNCLCIQDCWFGSYFMGIEGCSWQMGRGALLGNQGRTRWDEVTPVLVKTDWVPCFAHWLLFSKHVFLCCFVYAFVRQGLIQSSLAWKLWSAYFSFPGATIIGVYCCAWLTCVSKVVRKNYKDLKMCILF